jgi:hypothetical protein
MEERRMNTNMKGPPTGTSAADCRPLTLLAIRLPVPQVEFINEMAKLNGVRTSQFVFVDHRAFNETIPKGYQRDTMQCRPKPPGS